MRTKLSKSASLKYKLRGCESSSPSCDVVPFPYSDHPFVHFDIQSSPESSVGSVRQAVRLLLKR